MFLNSIKEHFKNGQNVEFKTTSIEFHKRVHPKLPYEAHNFPGFSDRVSGGYVQGLESYLDIVLQITGVRFARRVRYWNTSNGEQVYYDWPAEVCASIKS